MTIAKTFDSLKQAERYHFKLYNRYDKVELVKSPMFSEHGIYVWIVG
jgi:hypothetical protein